MERKTKLNASRVPIILGLVLLAFALFGSVPAAFADTTQGESGDIASVADEAGRSQTDPTVGLTEYRGIAPAAYVAGGVALVVGVLLFALVWLLRYLDTLEDDEQDAAPGETVTQTDGSDKNAADEPHLRKRSTRRREV